MSEQIAVRLPDELLRQVDELIRSGDFPSRAELIRQATRGFLRSEQAARVGAAIADGYRRIPQADDDLEAATAAAIASIEEEPW